MKKGHLVWLLFTLVVLNSCFLKKKITEKGKIGKNENSIVDSILRNQNQFKTMDIRFSFDYKSDKESLSANGILRMYNDSMIWVSISPGLGIEAARAMITKDSVYVLNRLNSTYFISDFTYLNNLLAVELNYHILQSILINNLFLYPDTNFNNFDSNYNTNQSDNYYTIKTKEEIINKQDSTNHSLRLNNQFKTVSISLDQKQSGLNINYLDQKYIGNNILPGQINVKAIKNKKIITANVNYKRIKLNEEIRTSFKISDRYKKIKIKTDNKN